MLATAVAVVALAAAGIWFWTTWVPPRVDMARFVPQATLAYFEVPNAAALATELTESDAWERLAPPLGLSSQLDYAGPVASWLGRLELGPDDAVALGRAQFAVALLGLEAGPSETTGDEGALVVKPRFAILVKTHTRASTARDLAGSRLPMLARRAYGETVAIDATDYNGTKLSVARPPGAERQMVWAVVDDVVVVGNHEEAVRAVVDAATGRAPPLAGDFYLERLRGELESSKAAIFGFVSRPGAGQLAGIGPSVVAGTLGGDASGTGVASVVASVSQGTLRAIGYAGGFDRGRFVDRYYFVTTPAVADALRAAVRPSHAPAELFALVPPEARDVSVVGIERPGETFETLLTTVSGRVDVGVAAALTQIAIEMRRSYGVEPAEPVSPMLGDALAFVDFGEGAPVMALFEVRDAAALGHVVARYLTKDGATVRSTILGGRELLVSTHEDGRAAAFVGRFLVLGTEAEVGRAIASASGEPGATTGMAKGEALARALDGTDRAIVASAREDRTDPSELMLAISKAFRATDGDPRLLAEPAVRDALDGLPPAVSVTELRDDGLYTETRSAVGSLAYATAFAGE
jgi:hypothetical protein